MGRFFNNNDIVLFQGDSITDCSRLRDDPKNLGNGYPAFVKAIYNTLFPSSTTTFVNKGCSGDRVRNLLEKYQSEIYDIQPTFISIMIGINDVWRRYDNNDPCSLERFSEEYTKLLEKLRDDFPLLKIMIIEPFLTPAMPERVIMHEDLDPKREFIKTAAKQYADFYLPLQSIFNKKMVADFTAAELAADCVHPTSAGHSVIAAEYLKVLEVL